jgi:hypothetical protein
MASTPPYYSKYEEDREPREHIRPPYDREYEEFKRNQMRGAPQSSSTIVQMSAQGSVSPVVVIERRRRRGMGCCSIFWLIIFAIIGLVILVYAIGEISARMGKKEEKGFGLYFRS